jgi:hypothetical protein
MFQVKMLIALLGLSLFSVSCREKSSKEEITKPQIRVQIQEMQNPSEETVRTRMGGLSDEQREQLIRSILPTISDEMMQKLLLGADLAPALERILLSVQKDLNIAVEELQKRSLVLNDMGISARRKVKIKFNHRVFIPMPVDPELSFRVVTKHKKFDCDKLQETEKFWQQFLSITKEPKFRLMTSKVWIEETIKTCLLFHRLKSNLEQCGLETNELEQICQMGIKEEELEE